DRALIRGMPIDTCQSLRLARRLLPFALAMKEKNGRNTLFSSTTAPNLVYVWDASVLKGEGLQKWMRSASEERGGNLGF
ncbi:hypothetical protein HAX54_023370, partial [Datura stramonium]|nr:hypothetical protein [Datura stramonium]